MTARPSLIALGNPVRIEILGMLRDGERTVSEIHGRFDISRPAISRHLRVLQDAGLVTFRASGRQHLYHLQRDGFDDVRAWLDSFWDEALPRFAQVAESLEPR